MNEELANKASVEFKAKSLEAEIEGLNLQLENERQALRCARESNEANFNELNKLKKGIYVGILNMIS